MKSEFKTTYGAVVTLCLLVIRTFAQETKYSVVYAGSTIVINCPIDIPITTLVWNGPPESIVYYDPGLNVINPAIGEISSRLSVAANQSLILSNTIVSDSRTLTCYSPTPIVRIGINVIIVRVKPSSPEITSSVTKESDVLRASEDKPFTVNCTSSGGYPAPNVVLYKVGIHREVLGNTSEGVPVGNTFTVTLTVMVKPQRKDDQKKLQCLSYYPTPANAQDDQVSESLSIYLYLKPLRPPVIQPPTVIAGENVTVECKTNGSRPAATILWKLNDQTYASTTTINNDTETQTFTTMSVFSKRVTAADNGQMLECVVSHMALDNNMIASASLNVQFKPLGVRIYKPAENINANGQNSMLITCTSATSNPVSMITWNMGDIGTSTQSHVDRLGEYGGTVRTSTIQFKPTRDNDGATVRCEATNNFTGQHEVSNSTVIDNIIYSPIIVDIPNRDVVEGETVMLPCYASSKPPARFTWRKDSVTVEYGQGTVPYNGLNYTIYNASRSQAGTYTCIADSQVQPNDFKQTLLTVLYPPDITVVAINTTFHSSVTNVTCEASGVPDNYTYEGWMHTWNGHVVKHPEPLPKSRVLTLTKLSYAHSGVYMCGASNGVKNTSYGEGGLLVKSPPILVGDVANTLELKASGQLMRVATVTFLYYSNAGRGNVTVQKTNSTEEDVREIHLRDVDELLPVFDSKIKTSLTEATLEITVANMSHFGSYDVYVANEMGSVQLSLLIQPQGPPETPSFVNSTILDHQSVNILWVSGFPNGFNQTFIIQLSTDNSTWRNITQNGGMAYQQTHSKTIDNLASNQLYYVRMLAFNAEGESEPTNIYNFKTATSPNTPTPTPVPLIAGGAVGGVVAAVIIVVIFVIVRRRKDERMQGSPKDKGAFVMSRNENEGYDNGDEEVINRLYESAGVTETVVGASTSKQVPPADVENIYAKVNKKPEVVYAITDKLKGRKIERQQHPNTIKSLKDGKKKDKPDKKKTKTGDVYENAPSILSGKESAQQSGESVYEVTSIPAPAAPKKSSGSDGLVYADLEFGPKTKGPTKIIGIEDRCEYTTIDLAKKAHPLPDSDDEDKTKQ